MRRSPRRVLATLAVLGAAAVPSAAAQMAPSATAAAATITEHDVRRRIEIIAHDSMQGRDTPSRGLELTAQYIADEFRRFGLTPGGDNGTWLQRYTISRRKLDVDHSSVTLRAGGTEAHASFATAARLASGGVPSQPVSGPVLVLGGALSAQAVAGVDVANRIVFVFADYRRPEMQQAFRAMYLAKPKAILVSMDADSAMFAARVRGQARERIALDLGTPRAPIVELREGAVRPVLTAAGIDPAALRAATTPVVRDLPALAAQLDLREIVTGSDSAPNTIGILEGSDPVLRKEYVVFSAHMDHIGISPGQPDSINNGADDDASGTTAILELAEAFSQPGARPKRSLLFITVSGEEKGLWGSRYFTEHPTVPLGSMVANINIDMIGRNWRDTVVVIGREHSDLGATLARVNAAHPELGVAAIDDRWPEERFYFRSDHYNFARKGIPALFFFSGVHEDYHRVSDSPEKIDAEKEARIIRLIYHLGQEIANAANRPAWRPESRAEIVEE